MAKKLILSLSSFVVPSMIALPLLLVIAWETYTIYDNVTEGKAYGFQIGDSKKDVFTKIKSEDQQFEFHSVWLFYPYPYENSRMEIITISDLNYEKLDNANPWIVTIGSESLLNSIRFTFKNGFLKELNRHRQVMEFP